jgi:hypothetical protein
MLKTRVLSLKADSTSSYDSESNKTEQTEGLRICDEKIYQNEWDQFER